MLKLIKAILEFVDYCDCHTFKGQEELPAPFLAHQHLVQFDYIFMIA